MAYFPDNDDGFTTLQALCLSEAATALSASQLLQWLPARSLSRTLAGPSRRFAARLAGFDHAITHRGLAQAAAEITQVWTSQLELHHRPPTATGQPTLVVANHPGLIDAAALLSCLGGHEIRLLTADRPMLAALPALAEHLIPVDSGHRGRALRAAWLLALVLGVVRFLQFVGELEHAVPAAEESSSGFGSFFSRGKEL